MSRSHVPDPFITYAMANGEPIWGEYAFVTDLYGFDERDDEVRLIKRTYRLLAEEEIVLPDPYPIEDDEDAPTPVVVGESKRIVADGWGSEWVKCDRADCGLEVVRPGKVQCWCDHDEPADAVPFCGNVSTTLATTCGLPAGHDGWHRTTPDSPRGWDKP